VVLTGRMLVGSCELEADQQRRTKKTTMMYTCTWTEEEEGELGGVPGNFGSCSSSE
jgi:hypothetical protein